jgi:hypothetical protein
MGLLNPTTSEARLNIYRCYSTSRVLQYPVQADEEEQAAEAAAVMHTAAALCPMRIALERVVISPSGVVMACWQVLKGTEPVKLRASMQVRIPVVSSNNSGIVCLSTTQP